MQKYINSFCENNRNTLAELNFSENTEEAMTMLNLVFQLIQCLNKEGICYCHWKSNFYLEDSLNGKRDLDILVARNDTQRFESVLASLGFKQVRDPLQKLHNSVIHYYGLDAKSGKIVHLHVFYRIITGESLLKNYNFPIEKLLLQNSRKVSGLPLPQEAAELLCFVLRTILKYISVIEYLLRRRRILLGYEAATKELEYLLANGTVKDCEKLLEKWFPTVDKVLFYRCLDALQKKTVLMYHFWLARKLRKQLKEYERFSRLSTNLLRINLLFKRLYWRLFHAEKSKQLVKGGALIVFTGPEASGKTTLATHTANWLGEKFNVRYDHLGKPSSTWMTFLPNLTVPMLRRIAPRHRASAIENPSRDNAGENKSSLLYCLRSVLLAWDRRALAMKIHKRVIKGNIVICDRYPSQTIGAADSIRLEIPSVNCRRHKFITYLAKVENRLYQKIPPPDAVIQLKVPVEVAVKRNQIREKEIPECADYVRQRHQFSVPPSYPTADMYELDTGRPQQETILQLRKIIWDAL